MRYSCPTPAGPTMRPWSMCSGANLSPYPVGPTEHWELDPAAVEARVNERTRLILVNSPANPSGVVESRARLRGLVEVAERHDLWVLSDEAYDELVFDGNPTATGAGLDSERVISVFSFSKTYAMTGWPALATSSRRRSFSRATGPSPRAGRLLRVDDLAACRSRCFAGTTGLRGRDGACISTRRDEVARQLDEFGCGYHLPGGAFFVMVDISPTGLDSWSFSRLLLERGRSASFPVSPSEATAKVGFG